MSRWLTGEVARVVLPTLYLRCFPYWRLIRSRHSKVFMKVGFWFVSLELGTFIIRRHYQTSNCMWVKCLFKDSIPNSYWAFHLVWSFLCRSWQFCQPLLRFVGLHRRAFALYAARRFHAQTCFQECYHFAFGIYWLVSTFTTSLLAVFKTEFGIQHPDHRSLDKTFIVSPKSKVHS